MSISAFVDHVKCTNCDTVQYVERGSDCCLACGYEGALTWMDEDEPEVYGEPEILTQSQG